MQKPAQPIRPSLPRRLVKHPFFGFIMIGLALIALQVTAMLTGGAWPKSSVLNGFATVLIYSIVGFGFTYLLGYAGLASLGTAGFVGLTSYLTAYLLKSVPGIPYIVVILAALAVSLILGVAVGFVSLRIEGIFLAIVTLGLSEILYQVFNNWIDFTNGPNGQSISRVPVFQTMLGMGTTDARRWFFIFLVAVTVVLMMLTYNLGKSRTGRAMLAMKNSQSAAQAMGISLLKYRLLAFLLSTLYAGFAGVMFMSYFRFSAPQNYTILFSLNILAAVLIGGSRNLIGTLAGSFIVFGITPIFLQDIPLFNKNPWIINTFIGVVILAIVLFYPGGMAQLVIDAKTSLRKRFARKGAPTAGPATARAGMLHADSFNSELAKKIRFTDARGARQTTPDGSAAQVTREELPEGLCLRLDGLSMAFGGLRAVDNLSFDVREGEIFGLIGPNGAGKTTVFNCITQFYKPTSGRILFRNHAGQALNLNRFPVHRILSLGIVRTFQNVEVIGELSILDNLLIAAHGQYRRGVLAQMLSLPSVKREEKALRERAETVLSYCGLTHLRDFSPLGQPYGVLKRIELARTLMAQASLIILDEPAAGLNDQETLELARIIRRIRDDFDVTLFVVEHNMGLMMDICDHICAISFGKMLAYGTAQEIQKDPIVQEAYLGTSDKAELEAP